MVYRPAMAARPRVGLVGCVKTKLEWDAPAEDLYASPLFRGRRARVERTCDRWFILSAKHRLLRPKDVIAPYDLSLASFSDADRRRWSAAVLEDLHAQLGALAGFEFEIHAGHEYRNYGLRDGLDRAGALSVCPVAGLDLGGQLRYYAEDRPASTVASSGNTAGLVARPDIAGIAARRLWDAWRGAGIFGERSMPESRLPEGVGRGGRTHALFVTLTVALDYMRDADALWDASRRAIEAEDTRWLFDPAMVHRADADAVQEALRRARVAMRPTQDARIWRTVSTTLLQRFDADPRRIATDSANDAPSMIAELRRVPGDFPWLKGRKIAPLWVRMMAHEVGLPLRGLEQIPIPVDIHIARTTFASGGLVGSFHGTVGEAAPAIEALWADALRDGDPYPLQIDQALWLQSRLGCSRRRDDGCPREAECVLTDLCTAGTLRFEGDTLVVETETGASGASSARTSGPVHSAVVWDRIVAHVGEAGFLTRHSIDITYDVEGDAVVVRAKKGARIPRQHFEQALERVPFGDLADVPEDLWGRSYIFAILMDGRIRGDDW